MKLGLLVVFNPPVPWGWPRIKPFCSAMNTKQERYPKCGANMFCVALPAKAINGVLMLGGCFSGILKLISIFGQSMVGFDSCFLSRKRFSIRRCSRDNTKNRR